MQVSSRIQRRTNQCVNYMVVVLTRLEVCTWRYALHAHVFIMYFHAPVAVVALNTCCMPLTIVVTIDQHQRHKCFVAVIMAASSQVYFSFLNFFAQHEHNKRNKSLATRLSLLSLQYLFCLNAQYLNVIFTNALPWMFKVLTSSISPWTTMARFCGLVFNF